MADREIKNIATVDIIEEASGEENLFVEANGLVRRLPSSNFSGGGSGAGIDITGTITIPEGGSASDPSTFILTITCPYTFEQLQTIRETRAIDVLITQPEDMGGITFYNYMRASADYTEGVEMIRPMLPVELQSIEEFILISLALDNQESLLLVLYNDITIPESPVLGAAIMSMGD